MYDRYICGLNGIICTNTGAIDVRRNSLSRFPSQPRGNWPRVLLLVRRLVREPIFYSLQISFYAVTNQSYVNPPLCVQDQFMVHLAILGLYHGQDWRRV